MSRIIYNNIIPFKGFKALTIFPCIFARKKARPLSDVIINHERIHLSQQIEVLLVSLILAFLVIVHIGTSLWWMLAALPMFYLWYGIEYLVRSIMYRSWDDGYKNISFEQEAYINELECNYVPDRKFFAWLTFLTKKSFNTKK